MERTLQFRNRYVALKAVADAQDVDMDQAELLEETVRFLY